MFDGKQEVLRIHLSGTFSVSLSSGKEITPTSAKAQGLLALLATERSGARSRNWVQSKLWSDRAPQQASGSMRQCLQQIKKSFGDCSDILLITRQKVGLDLSRIEILLSSDQEFLEGLDVKDEAFEEWLRTERSAAIPKDLSSPNPRIRQEVTETKPTSISINSSIHGLDDRSLANWLCSSVTDDLARMLKENFSVNVSCGSLSNYPESDWNIDISVVQLAPDQAGIRISLVNATDERFVWADRQTVALSGGLCANEPSVMRMLNHVVQAFADELLLNKQSEDCPDTLSRRAIRKLFQIQDVSVEEAQRTFRRAFELKKRGLYLAWQAQTNTIKMIERHEKDHDTLREEAAELCARALELEPNNSMVLATVANTQSLMFRNYERSMHLAKQSTKINPSNPMGWFALSCANMHLGLNKEALRHTLRAHQLAEFSPHRFWWDSQVFAAALTSRRLDEAQVFAEKCWAQNPNYRPPLRYLIALYAQSDQPEKALEMAAQLRKLEPEFSIDQLYLDTDYPVSLLHRDVGIDLNKIANLA